MSPPREGRDGKGRPKGEKAADKAAEKAAQKSGRDRRASRRNPVQVRLEIADLRGSFTARTVDVSRGGLFAATAQMRPIGTLLRIRVLGPKGEPILAVGVVVRCFTNVGEATDGLATSGLAIALTSTSEAWDQFWDDVSATDEDLDL
jgi:hypothetical protein